MAQSERRRETPSWVLWGVLPGFIAVVFLSIGLAFGGARAVGVISGVVGGAAGIGLVVASVFFAQFLRRNAQSLFITTLGFTNAGKTTYLTVLFDNLRVAKIRGYSFMPYGTETHAALTANLETLHAGQTIPHTTDATTVFYQAAVEVPGLRRRRYVLVMPDFPGEDSEKIADARGRPSLLQSELFKQATESDIVFLAVDGAALSDGDPSQVAQVVDRMMEAVDGLAFRRRGLFPGQSRLPVALLILKSDCLAEMTSDKDVWQTYAYRVIERLTSQCENRFRCFRVFFVSAVAALDPSRYPGTSRALSRTQVIEPFMWAMHQLASARPDRSTETPGDQAYGSGQAVIAPREADVKDKRLP